MKKKILKDCLMLQVDEGTYRKQSIYIDCEGKIEKLVNELTLEAAGYEVIDCSGKYAVPGLINAHAHLFSSGKPSNFHASQKLLKVGYRLMRTVLGKALLFKIMENNAEIALSSG